MLTFFFSHALRPLSCDLPHDSQRKSCLIFTSDGGGGHRSADKALTDYLQDDFNIELSFLVRDILAPLDPVNFFTFGRYNGEDLYNYCLGRRWYTVTNLIGHFGTWSVWWHGKKIEKLLHDFLFLKKPDVIISVIPFYNGPLLKAASSLNIPCFIVPTDLDSQFFAYGIEKIEYDKWWYVLPFEDAQLLKQVRHIIPAEHILYGGFPIRKSFFERKDKQHIKRNLLNIQNDKPIVMLLMGAGGSNGCFDCMKSIIQMDIPLHVIICLGKNKKKLSQRIATLKIPSHISITLVGFTEHIADLMAVSDVLVTKSGTVSVCEAIYTGLPLILDNTSKVPVWEQFNHEFIADRNYGESFTSYNDLKNILEKYLLDSEYRNSKKMALQNCPKDNIGLFIQMKMRELCGLSHPFINDILLEN